MTWISNKTVLNADHYCPEVVKRHVERIFNTEFQNLYLYGFSDNMKWLTRLLSERGIEVVLCDWREQFCGYDCGGKNVIHFEEIPDDAENLLVICPEEINALKAGIRYIQQSQKSKTRVIYDRLSPNKPIEQEEPYKSIYSRAKERAQSMISAEQLFDLIQIVEQTRFVDGNIAEFGSYQGGSSAVIAEATKYFAPQKEVYLFDTFSGIPESKYGLDFHWGGSFADNSLNEVRDAFQDMTNVFVVPGNICETYTEVKTDLCFGYLASDTYESREILTSFIWSRLNIGGILAVCDYGSFPNALPLTVHVDKFIEDHQNEMFVFKPNKFGVYLLKISSD